MPEPQPVRAQTIKQAKASFKSRSNPTLSDLEKKQMERAAQLERRAWGVKERDKRKTEAAKKKADKDRKEQLTKERLQMSTQRRCDKFGYKSSQMHLGAFMGRTGISKVVKEAIAVSNECVVEDDFDANEMDTLWDELESSSQIARELAMDVTTGQTTTVVSKKGSFESDDFDLTVEDIEGTENMQLPKLNKVERDRKLMPPPPLAAMKTATTFSTTKAPAKPAMPALVHGFTMSELESFVDDDLQLTQADPG